MVNEDMVFEVDGKKCAVDTENPDTLQCVDPETGNEEAIDIEDLDEPLPEP